MQNMTGNIGDRQSDKERIFNRLYLLYQKALCRYAFHFLENTELAREVVQNAYIKLWLKGKFEESELVLLSYLHFIVRNECFDLIRHSKREEVFRQKITLLYMEKIPDSFEEYVNDELRKTLDESIARLPEPYRNIFMMNRFEHLKYQEIADKLHISIKTVEAYMSKGLRLLRDQLSDYLRKK